MRDTSEPLLAIGDVADSEKASSQEASTPGSGPTEATEASTEDPPVDELGADPGRSRSDTRDLGFDAQPPRQPMKSHSGARLRVAAPFDPIAKIFESMRRERRVGLSAGLAGALLLHGAAAVHGYSALLDLSAFAAAVRSAVVDDVRATYAVEVNKPPPPPPPAPEPEPEKPQPPPQRAPTVPQAQAEKPPAPAQAAKVLTADPDPNEPLDLTDQGFVSGDGDRFAGGVTSATGTSKTAVRDLNAKPGGVVGGKGAAPPPPPPKQDLSRPAAPAVRAWDCGFPAEADVEQIDFMRVSIVVTVGIDGRAQSVTVLKDPGYGFGNQARQCALRKTYNVGLNAEGKPIVTTTPPFIVTFRR